MKLKEENFKNPHLRFCTVLVRENQLLKKLVHATEGYASRIGTHAQNFKEHRSILSHRAVTLRIQFL